MNQASVSSLSLVSTLSPGPAGGDEAWRGVHVHVLPLFNGEPLRMPIEELNQLVKKHIQTVVSRSFPRAIGTLEQDIAGLLGRGMLTLNVKLDELEDRKLLPRLGDVWEFFWHGILPYVEGVFHPLKTDALMQSLSRTPKPPRPASPSLPEDPAAMGQSIDVRVLALRSFRDSILLPIFPRLHSLLVAHRDPFQDRSYLPKLQQMLLVLLSSAKHPLPSPNPAPAPAPAPAPPSQGESAVIHLLRALRGPHAGASSGGGGGGSGGGPTRTRPFSVAARHPSFFSSSAPRDRRGRVARKSATGASNSGASSSSKTPTDKRYGYGHGGYGYASDGNDDSETTPRNARFEREKRFLESLRSPELEREREGEDVPEVEGEGDEREPDTGAGETMREGPVHGHGHAGGWGLGRGRERERERERRGAGEDDDEDEPLDWEQAHGVVERMVGLRG